MDVSKPIRRYTMYDYLDDYYSDDIIDLGELTDKMDGSLNFDI
jgi:hypothetical protein